MTEILEPIKAKIARFHSQAIMFTLEEVLPLMTTIESQKEEIENMWSCPDCAFTFHGQHEDVAGGYSCPLCAELRLEKELASQKAITELAVKWLEEIASGGMTAESTVVIAVSALSEIARLTHDPIS